MTPDNVKRAMLKSYQRLLQPLFKILLRNGVKYSELAQIVKAAFVESAVRQGLIDDDPSVAKIAEVTGLTDNQVSEVLSLDAANVEASGKEENDLVIRVLEAWHRDEGYVGIYGLANEISLEEFKSLVIRYAPSMEVKRVLSLLIQAGCVRELAGSDSSETRYKCIDRTFLPDPLTEPQLERMGYVISNLVNTLDHNFHEEGKPLVEKRVWLASGLHPKYLESFDQQIREKSDEFLVSLDNWLSTCHDEKDQDGQSLVQTGVSLFHYIEPNDSRKHLLEILKEKGLKQGIAH